MYVYVHTYTYMCMHPKLAHVCMSSSAIATFPHDMYVCMCLFRYACHQLYQIRERDRHSPQDVYMYACTYPCVYLCLYFIINRTKFVSAIVTLHGDSAPPDTVLLQSSNFSRNSRETSGSQGMRKRSVPSTSRYAMPCVSSCDRSFRRFNRRAVVSIT